MATGTPIGLSLLFTQVSGSLQPGQTLAKVNVAAAPGEFVTANILTFYTSDVFSKASVVSTLSKELFSKAYIPPFQAKDFSVKANILTRGSGNLYSKTNIISRGTTKNVSVKVSLRGYPGSYTKTNIFKTGTYNNSVKVNIHVEYSTYSIANIKYRTVDKKYFYRVYDGNDLKSSWANEVLTIPTFRTVINGGAGDITLRLARNFSSFGEEYDIKLNNKVEIWVSDREAPNGQLLYSGYISGYRPVLDRGKEYVEITILSYVAELSRYMLKDGDATEVAYLSVDPSEILKDVIDKYRSLGGSLSYTPDSIDLTGTTVSYTFNTNTVREAFDTVIKLCPFGWYWFVGPDNIVYLKPKSDVADHNFTIKKNIVYLETWRRIEDLVNQVYFTGGGDPPLYRVYENGGSVDTYGIYAHKVVDQRVTVPSTAEIISQRIIENKKDPEIRTKITITDSNGFQDSLGYDIESVRVGQTMKIVGFREAEKTFSYWNQMQWDVDVWDQTLASSAVNPIQILSISYLPNTIEIEASSRLPEVPKRIEDINRNLENSQTVNNPDTPS